MSSRDTEVRLPRATKVKNKQAADRQVDNSFVLYLMGLKKYERSS